MFRRKLKDEFIKKKCYLTDIETGNIIGVIYCSENNIVNTMFFCFIIVGMMSTCLLGTNIGIIIGIITMLIVLYLSTEKIKED